MDSSIKKQARIDVSSTAESTLPVILTDMVLFLAMLLVARIEGWNIVDIVWSLWSSSLIVGYATILVFHFRAFQKVNSPVGLFFAIPAALIGICFFTFHFGLFHFVHAGFLQEFFPLEGVLKIFGASNGFIAILDAIRTCIKDYWPFILSSLVLVFPPLNFSAAISRVHIGTAYLNVVRMHLLIFVFAFLRDARYQNLVLIILLSFYFFPIGSVYRLFIPQNSKVPTGKVFRFH